MDHHPVRADAHADVGEVVGAVNVEALGLLLWGGSVVVLHVSVLHRDVCALGAQEVWHIRVRRRAVVAFVEVVAGDLPVVLAIELVAMVELILVEVELLEALLLVDGVKLLLPRHLGFLVAVHVDPDEAVDVDVDVDGEEAVDGLVEAVEFLVLRSFSQFAVEAVRPAVVSTGKDGLFALVLLDDGVGAVPTYVVERVDLAVTPADDDDVVVGDGVSQEFAGLANAVLVGDEEPPSGEDCSPFQLVHLLRCVPLSRQGSHAIVGRFGGLGLGQGVLVAPAEVAHHCGGHIDC